MFERIAGLVCATLVVVSPSVGATQSVQDEVDRLTAKTASAVVAEEFEPVVSIDHARLALNEGVEMPASIVQIFSAPETNSAILVQTIRAGLDLPYRVLTFDSGDKAEQIYTTSDFLRVRHGISDQSALKHMNEDLEAVTSGMQAAPIAGLEKGFGILEIESPHDVAESVARLKSIVMSQDDTVWFGEIDFQAQAATHGITLQPAVLLLFGGPAPGGIAMGAFPAIGLDAFCQKLLVYQDETGSVRVIYNDIAALAELHYGKSAEPHRLLNQRLTQTFRTALK